MIVILYQCEIKVKRLKLTYSWKWKKNIIGSQPSGREREKGRVYSAAGGQAVDRHRLHLVEDDVLLQCVDEVGLVPPRPAEDILPLDSHVASWPSDLQPLEQNSINVFGDLLCVSSRGDSVQTILPVERVNASLLEAWLQQQPLGLTSFSMPGNLVLSIALALGFWSL
jgi:hypothetical protein